MARELVLLLLFGLFFSASAAPIGQNQFDDDAPITIRSAANRVPPSEKAAVADIIARFYGGQQTSHQLMAAMRAAAPSLHHLVFLANDRIHQFSEANLQPAAAEYDKAVSSAPMAMKAPLGDLAEFLSQGTREIDSFTQMQVAENAIQIVSNIPAEEEAAMRKALSKRLNLEKANAMMAEVRSISPSLHTRLEQLATATQRKFDEYIDTARRQHTQMLSEVSKTCPRVAAMLSQHVNHISAISLEMLLLEKNILAVQILKSVNDMRWKEINWVQDQAARTHVPPAQVAGLVSQHAPTLSEAIGDANQRLLRVLRRRLSSMHEWLQSETAKFMESAATPEEAGCVYKVDHVIDEFIDSIEDETADFMSTESHQRALEAFGQLSNDETSKIRKMFSGKAEHLDGAEIAEDVKANAPTINSHYEKIVQAVDGKIADKEAEAASRVLKAAAEQRSLPSGRPSEMQSVGHSLASRFTALNSGHRRHLRELLPKFALRMLNEQPYTEKESMKEVIYRWITNDFNNVMNELQYRTPTLYASVGPFRRLVDEKKRMLRGDAARLFEETAAESLRKLLHDVAGQRREAEPFSVRESLRALPAPAQRQISTLVGGLTPEEKRIFTFTA